MKPVEITRGKLTRQPDLCIYAANMSTCNLIPVKSFANLMPENQPRLFRFLRLTGLYIVVALSRVWVTGYPGLGKFYFARLLKQQSLKIYS